MTETDPIWGRFTVESLPFVQMIENPSLNEMIVNGGGAGFVAGTIFVPLLITYFKLWKPLWSWLS